ncbi:MAG: alpha-galactosidase [Clostridiales bacterium]|nr:alpha-galactosidase [Clostridiales bacterium]
MKCCFTLSYIANGKPVTVYDLTENGDFALDISDNVSRRTVKITAKRDMELCDYREHSHDFFTKSDDKRDSYFMNGYQSWTDTREFYLSEKEHNVNRVPKPLMNIYMFDRYGDALFYDYKKDMLHGYDVFYKKGQNSCFVASVNEKNAYLIFEVNRKTGDLTLISDIKGKTLASGETFILCDYIYHGDYCSGVSALKKHYSNKSPKKIFGYTSWYNYYQDINEEIITRDLQALDERFNLFQIDDGYETYVGDWLDVDKKKFANGLAPIVDAAHKKGYMAGIWLAPFVAEEKSRLFTEKQSWFKVDKSGQPVKCGSNWSGFYALDLENKEVRDYISTCLKTYADMGFDFFKLDFLYAANFPKYNGKTSSQAAHDAYVFLREILGDKLILGCGATLSNACGVFDYMRVGPDVSLKFDDVWYMRFMHRERISTKVTLQNTIYRSFLNGVYFGNDPDVFLLRDDNLSLSKEQRRALITINALFGSVMMTSDNISDYDDEKRKLLAYALDLFENGEIVSFERRNKIINIVYKLRGESRELNYHTEKGVLI